VLWWWMFRPKPVEVEAAKVSFGSVEETVTNTRAGTVKARLRAKISPQIGGLVKELPHRKGDRVKAGELLLKIDDALQAAQLRLAREDVFTAEALAEEACLAAELAERELQRGLALENDGITSAQNLDTLESARDRARAGCRAAQATLEQARAAVRLAEAQYEMTEVRAPFDGIVADHQTEVGEWITPSPPGVPIPAVLDLLDPSSIYVSAPIDEVDGGRVKVGQEVRLTVDSHPGRTFAGTLVRVAPYVLDLLEQNRTVEVEVEFAEAQDAASILPGTSADAEIILNRKDRVLRVPTSAVAEGGKVLAVIDGELVEKTIESGLRNWQFVEVTGGLSEGDLVVTARDSTAIKPGARVEAREAP